MFLLNAVLLEVHVHVHVHLYKLIHVYVVHCLHTCMHVHACDCFISIIKPALLVIVHVLHQVDICAEEMNNNVNSHVMLGGDIKTVLKQVFSIPCM